MQLIMSEGSKPLSADTAIHDQEDDPLVKNQLQEGSRIQTSTALVAAHTSSGANIHPSTAATFPPPAPLAHDHDGPQFGEHTASGAWSEIAPSSKPLWQEVGGGRGARGIPSREKDDGDSNFKWGEEHADSNLGSKHDLHSGSLVLTRRNKVGMAYFDGKSSDLGPATEVIDPTEEFTICGEYENSPEIEANAKSTP
ncbi:hypothetical protein B0H19DRAFT_1244141 [Mycena capillaripes]|nr:hypothetical protein B0H19DRAFT_1244141 [Mycena capillaripes]